MAWQPSLRACLGKWLMCWGSHVGGRREAAQGPPSLEPEGADGTCSSNDEGHKAPKPRPVTLLLPLQAQTLPGRWRPSRLLSFCGSPESPSPGVPHSRLHRARATFRERRGAGCPAGQMRSQRWGWGTGGQGVWSCPPHPGRRWAWRPWGDRATPTCHDHFSDALPAPTVRPAEPRAPLSVPSGGQSSWRGRGSVLGASSLGGHALALGPLLPACQTASFLGASECGLSCSGGGPPKYGRLSARP